MITIPYTYVAFSFCLLVGFFKIGDFDEEKVKEICEIPPEVRVVAITPLGYPVKVPQATQRKSLERIVSEEVYTS